MIKLMPVDIESLRGFAANPFVDWTAQDLLVMPR